MFKIFKKLLSIFIILTLFSSIWFAESELDNLEDFKIVETQVLNFKQIYVTFNQNILEEEGVVRDFKLTNKDDSWDELYTVNAELDEFNKKMLLLTFDNEAQANWVYELLVINLLDEFWRNIESWINSIATVQMPNEIIEEIDLNSTDNEEPIIEDTFTWTVNVEVEWNEVENDINVEVEWNEVNVDIEWNEVENNIELELNSWEDVWEDFVIKNIESESKDIENLPETWPANLFIFILASILWLLIFVFRFKKS